MTPPRRWTCAARSSTPTRCASTTRSPCCTTASTIEAAHAQAVRVLADLPDLPGVAGEAGTAAAFTGRWTEQAVIGAVPEEGKRVYRLDQVDSVPAAPGRPRPADGDEIELLV